jgi:putative endonuclease
MERGGCIYIMTNKWKSTLYIGVTSDLRSRVFKHQNHVYSGSFSDKYNLEYCIYYEKFTSIEEAIAREKEIK